MVAVGVCFTGGSGADGDGGGGGGVNSLLYY